MKCKDDYHHYELDKFDHPQNKVYVKFIQKELLKDGKPGELVTIQDGTTNEEVLKMLIHRITAMNTIVPSIHNSAAIINCENALHALEERTRDRKERGVEGKKLV